MTKLIDIHTHNPSGDLSRIEVKVFNTYKDVKETPFKYCISAHPWFLENFDVEEFKKCLKEHLNIDSFFALGEIGLDRIKGIKYSKQIEIFKKLIDFSIEYNIPRIVIHSVKANEDIYKILKDKNFKAQVIFHDFNENEQITKKLLSLNSYFSFGSNFLKDNAKASKTFPFIPKERVFFETDENNDLVACYKKAQLITGHSYEDICFNNFERILKL